jgi:hypothetical protein
LGSPSILRHFTIHSVQAIFLKEIARREGRMIFDWEKAGQQQNGEAVQGMVADLTQKGLVKYVEYVTHAAQEHGTTYLELTDPGRRVVAQLEDAERKRVEIQSDAPPIVLPRDEGGRGGSSGGSSSGGQTG